MNTTSQKPVDLGLPTTKQLEQPAYEPPRITRKRSLERVTLGTGTVSPGGKIGP